MIHCLKSTADWTSLTIEPVLGIMERSGVSGFYVFFLNKFEKNPIKHKITFVVWRFDNLTPDNLRSEKKDIFAALKQNNKKRYAFESNEVFSGSNFSIENSLGRVRTDITIEDNFLELIFQQNRDSAKLKQIEEKGQITNIRNITEALKPVGITEDDMFSFIKELEIKESKSPKKLVLLIVFSSIVAIVVISIGTYVCFKRK